MFFDDKIFEFVVLEPLKFESLKEAIQKACIEHGKVKIRSSLISKIVIDGNNCADEDDLKRFIDYYPGLNEICKIHLQFPHDIIFPAEVQCASENVKTTTFFSGFLYEFKFMLTTKLLEDQADSYLANILRSITKASTAIEYPHTNWYHDQGMLRLTLPKRINETESDLRFEFDYSSFLKIYIYQPRKKKEESVADVPDIINFIGRMESEYSTYQLTVTIGIGYSPGIFVSGGKGNLHNRVYDLPAEAFWKPLVQSSTIQIKLSFDSEQGCRDFISHLHSAVTCPITFLSNPIEIQSPDLPLIPPNVLSWPWEIQYSVQMIMDCGDIGCYHFHKQNYISHLERFINNEKIDDALAFLAAIHANLKLQPMMEVIEVPRPVTVNFGDDFVLMRTVIITPTRKICCPPMQLMSSRAFRILGGAEKFIQVKFRDENMQMMKRDEVMMKQEVKHKLEPHEYTVIDDFTSDATNSKGEKFCFSDGVGIISLKFAASIKEEFNLAYLPSAFQIRCLGFKGVLSIDDKHPLLIDSGGDKLVLFRESQKKFDVSNSMEVVLGIVKHSAPMFYNSNRFNKPLINLWDQAATKQGLSTIFDKRVNELFTESLYHITSTLTDNSRFNDALKKLPNYINFQQIFRHIWINEPFFRSMVTAAALQQLSLFMQTFRSMLGIVDVTGILKEGQVFVQYSKHVGSLKDNDEKIICKGKVAVSRSPVYNIGDLRILEAIDIPQLHHLFDVIVFPYNGTRPHPDEMGGGDLDGDEYSVVWDPKLML
uniref:RNA-dependent RNA polymerase n=1 Tax=Panagrolaimus sp. ES5 TaxID=591445 RepID=A0AC34GXB2_9BILA